MPELRESVPKPRPVAKEPRCAEGPSVKTMLSDAELRRTAKRLSSQTPMSGLRFIGRESGCGHNGRRSRGESTVGKGPSGPVVRHRRQCE